MLFLGLRGQGKTRMLRMLVDLLDDAVPIVAGSEINDDPLAPLSKYARDLVADKGDACPIEWIGRDRRYHEKLATPDVTIADLIGEVDMIKHAEGRHLSSEDVMHFGLIPRTNRGIFCMNELPDLSPEDSGRPVQRARRARRADPRLPVRLDLDVCMVFSANPGGLHQPRPDRDAAQGPHRLGHPHALSAHPRDGHRDHRRERLVDRDDGPRIVVPMFLKEIVEETSRLARTSPHVNQQSGVSVRMSIANWKTWSRTPNGGPSPWASRRRSRASATWSAWSAARAARSSCK